MWVQVRDAEVFKGVENGLRLAICSFPSRQAPLDRGARRSLPWVTCTRARPTRLASPISLLHRSFHLPSLTRNAAC